MAAIRTVTRYQDLDDARNGGGVCVPRIGAPTWLLDGDDLDGSGVGNAGRESGDLLTSWVNKGAAAPSNAVQAWAGLYCPKIARVAINGRSGVCFDANVSSLTLSGSASNLAYAHSTGVFDIYIVLQTRNVGPTYQYVLGNTDTASIKGFGLQLSPTGNELGAFLTNGTTSICYLNATSLKLTPGVNNVVRIRANGSLMAASINGGTEVTQAFSGGLGSGVGTDWWVGRNPAGTQPTGAVFAYLAIYPVELTAGQSATLVNSLRRYYQT